MIALITPTGGRPRQLGLLARWMSQQTYKGEVLWVLVDDCEPRTADKIIPNMPKKRNWTIHIINPTVLWKPGKNTQVVNMQLAVKRIKDYKNITHIFIIEDDDYYAPNYLSVMMEHLEVFSVVGGKCTLFFKPNEHSWRVETGTEKNGASLFETGFKISMLPLFEDVMKRVPKFVDLEFWKAVPKYKKFLLYSPKRIAIGIKGLEGRQGIVAAHRTTMKNKDNINLFNFQLGKDAKYYENK